MRNNEDEACDTGLQLGLGLYSRTNATQTKKEYYNDEKTMMMKPLIYFDWFNLCSKEDQPSNVPIIHTNMDDHKENRNHSTVTKNVNDNVLGDNDNNNNNHDRRKKMKLTKDQSDFLEDYFKLHTTLDPAKKQALADQLNLKPRQLSVWFQNRRARTKFKQTEEDYQLLKKRCESLSHENRRLKKELQEHRSLKVEPSNESSIIQFPNSTSAELMTCSSCGNISQADRLLAERDNKSAN